MRLPADLTWKLRRSLNALGVDVVPFRHTRHPIARRRHLFAQHGIDLVLDVGANAGQYGRFLRHIGYQGAIVSFEPLSTAFESLRQAAAGDPTWETRRAAVGKQEGVAVLNVAGNSESSSLLPMLPAHLAAYPESRYTGTEQVPVTTLETVIAGLPDDRRIFLKVDTQGYERPVVEGAGAALQRIRGVQLEMSLVSLYEGEMLLADAIPFMAERGFVLMGFEPGASDSGSGQLLQVDGLFFRV
jgi:FkbM family methyltransferase